jgi:hypothetical protein
MEEAIDALTRVRAAAEHEATVDQTLDALTALHALRARLDEWEPRLIARARAGGASWAQLAGPLGVTSRQAAERRYLRMHRPTGGDPEATGDERVRAVRDQRAGDRAVTAWARDHGADLRQLAGQISALTDLGPDALAPLHDLHTALGSGDAADLVPLLAAAQAHLPAAHAGLADRVAAVAAQTDQVRQDSQDRRRPAAG